MIIAIWSTLTLGSSHSTLNVKCFHLNSDSLIFPIGFVVEWFCHVAFLLDTLSHTNTAHS